MALTSPNTPHLSEPAQQLNSTAADFSWRFYTSSLGDTKINPTSVAVLNAQLLFVAGPKGPMASMAGPDSRAMSLGALAHI